MFEWNLIQVATKGDILPKPLRILGWEEAVLQDRILAQVIV